MTISTTISRTDDAGNGVTTVFNFPYYFLADADLIVILVDSAGVETVQTITTHYTVIGAGVGAGGSVTMLTAPATGERLVIYRDPAVTQGVDYITGDAFPANVHETALDRLTMIAQRLRDLFNRSITLSEGAPSVDLTLPTPTADTTIAWNAGATALVVGPTVDDISSAATSAAAAATSATNAATSETNAATSATNAATAETNAATSATAAQAAADSVIWNDVQFKTFSDTPIAIVQGDDGALISVDTSGGNVVINLPSIAGLTLPFTIGIKKSTSDTNTVTINGDGTDTIESATPYVLSAQDDGATLIPDTDTSPDKWSLAAFGTGVSVSGDNTWTGTNQFNKTIYLKKGADIASANDLVLLADGNSNDITGTTTINGMTDGVSNELRHFKVDSALTLKHNTAASTGFSSLYIVQSVADVTLDAGAEFDAIYDGALWRIVNINLASGAAVVGVGKVVQIIEATPYFTYTSTTSIIPIDDTIPQNTEGAEIITVSITPESSTNRLIVLVDFDLIASTDFAMTVAMFQDTTSNAIKATYTNINSNNPISLHMKHEMAAGTTSATTFKIRVGVNSSGAVYVNGGSSSRLFGGTSAVRMSIVEIKA